MKNYFLSLILVILSSNVAAQDSFEWDASEDTKDIVYETPSSKLCRKWYQDMSDGYTQFNSNGTFSMVGTINSDYKDLNIPFKQVFDGTWKRVEKMYLHLQITNSTLSYDKSEVANLPARRRDELQKFVSKFNTSVRNGCVGQKFVYSIWRLDDDYFMFEEGGTKTVYVSDKKRKELKIEFEEQLKNKVYDKVEEMPQFPGGPSAMFEFLSKNIQYPEGAKKDGIQGRTIVTFIVEKDGSISNAKIVKSLELPFDEEALRVVTAMPKWIPGKHNGESVRVKFTVPVSFR